MTVTPKDLISLKQTLLQLPELEMRLSAFKSPIFADMTRDFDMLEDVCGLIDRAIDEEKATSIVRDGGMIRRGYNADADTLRRCV